MIVSARSAHAATRIRESALDSLHPIFFDSIVCTHPHPGGKDSPAFSFQFIRKSSRDCACMRGSGLVRLKNAEKCR
jgi:hypothetical protein